MKKLFFAALIAVCCFQNLSAQGIEFFHGTWAEALAKAKSEEKMIFVDAFASWCGPCKRMASTVFTDAKAGAFFNANFINAKFDMEKPENSDFAGKYPVSAYPTLMVIDGEGKIVNKSVGALTVEKLIEFGTKALGANDNTEELEEQYAGGKRDPEFMLKYIGALNRAGKPSLKVTNDYLNAQQDLSIPANLKILLEGTVEADSRVFDLLVKNRKSVAALEGEDKLKSRIERAAQTTVKKAIEFRDESLLEEAKSKMAGALPERSESFNIEADMSYYAATKGVKKYLKAADAFREKEVKNNSARLNDLCVTLTRTFPDEPKVLEQAADWAKDASDRSGLPEHYMTLAEIYKRMGKKEKSRQTAQKAIEAIGDKDNGMKARIEFFIQSIDSGSR